MAVTGRPFFFGTVNLDRVANERAILVNSGSELEMTRLMLTLPVVEMATSRTTFPSLMPRRKRLLGYPGDGLLRSRGLESSSPAE
jgi:hypothetical protein